MCDLHCPQCQKDLNNRQVSMSQTIVLTCRTCGLEVSRSERTASHLPPALDIDDIAAIEGALKDFSPAFERVEDSESALVWKRYSEDFVQELKYEANSHSVLQVAVLTTQLERKVTSDTAFQELLIPYAVQPIGYRISGTNGSRTLRGCCRLLSTNTLHPQLLALILGSLTNTLRNLIVS